MRSWRRIGLGWLVVGCVLAGCSAVGPAGQAARPAVPQPPAGDYARVAAEVEASLERDVVGAWFPRCVDREHGGFYANWSRAWGKQPSTGKFIVFQARQTWIAAKIAMARPEKREEFVGYARHGVEFLDQVMWDKECGGFYWGLDDAGKVTKAFSAEKHLYGEAFGIYAAAAAYEATGDKRALELALRAFRWVDAHAHDGRNGGYFEALTREGKPIAAPETPGPGVGRFPGGGFIDGYKSMNAHIHFLEALTELHRASGDGLVRARLEEMFLIVRDRIAVEPGCLNQWFTADWRAVPDYDSFGHDIETAFLLLEAAEELGMGADARTRQVARRLVDHCLDYGFDPAHGGVYDKGFAFGPVIDTKKAWWSQMEAMNALLLLHELYGRETERYWLAFGKQWEFVRTKVIDGEYPGVFGEVEADGTPTGTGKGQNWKAGYHDGRSLLRVGRRLQELAGE